MMQALEFEIRAEFGIFKRPDKQRLGEQQLSLTYNFIPKSTVFGMCGAILGLSGFGDPDKNKRLEFVTRLKHLKIAISPIYGSPDQPKPFLKTFVKFINYHGYGNEDGPLIVKEQLLVRPAFRITIIGAEDDENLIELARRLKSQEAVFRPYMGKNEFITDTKFVGLSKTTVYKEGKFVCNSIYPLSGHVSGVRDVVSPPKLLVLDEYPYSYDESAKHICKRFCYQDGEIYVRGADLNIGSFYRIYDDEKVIFAF
jgi:CRISPR-associated protein Cas5h